MRIIYILIFCSLLSVALLWLGQYKKLTKRAAAYGAALSMALAGVLLLLAVLPGNSSVSYTHLTLPTICSV